MNKFGIFLIVSLLALPLVFAANNAAGMGADKLNGTASQVNESQQTMNQGADRILAIENQERVRTGEYINEKGQRIQIQVENQTRLSVGNVTAQSQLELVQEKIQNRTKLQVHLSNGINAEIKIMPDTASATAIARLGLKVCNESNNCTIVLKEVGQGNQTKAAYEVQAQKQVKILGLIRAQMQVEAQIDAENGAVIKDTKPWWAFLATDA